MAAFLYRVGRFAHRRRGRVVLTWILVLAALAAGAEAFAKPMSSSFSIPGTEAQRALSLLEQRMPQAGSANASARVVFVARGGSTVTTPGAKAGIERTLVDLKGLPGVASVAD